MRGKIKRIKFSHILQRDRYDVEEKVLRTTNHGSPFDCGLSFEDGSRCYDPGLARPSGATLLQGGARRD